MYNLIVTGHDGAWDRKAYVLERTRVGEYTDDSLRARFRVLDAAALSDLTSFPSLFAYEQTLGATARLGRVTRVIVRGADVRFEFDILKGLPGITTDQLDALAFDLDITDSWEMNRTHWAIKDVELVDVLENSPELGMKGIRSAISGAVIAVSQPVLSTTSAVVERALSDAEKLIESQGATSGVDRIHTVFHGYLMAVAAGAGLSISGEPGVTDLLKELRQNHPALQERGTRANDIERVYRAIATIVDALNPLRNRASVAHPNAELLDEPEAMLVINTVRTLLHFIDSRIKAAATRR